MINNDQTVQTAVAEKNRLLWRSRRGMLELDLLLEGFIHRDYDALSADQRRDLTELLSYPDQLLLEYLLGRLRPTDQRLADVVDKIRHAAGR